MINWNKLGKSFVHFIDPEWLILWTYFIFQISDNVKALFRRGKAHIGAWNPEDARNDLERVIELDSSATKDARKQLKILEELKKQKDLEDRERLRGKLFGWNDLILNAF